MKSYAFLLLAVVVGVGCGLLSLTPLLAGQWLNLVVWALAGLALGLFLSGRRLVVAAGVIYGVCLSLSFLLFGFQGSPDRLPAFLLLSLGLSVIGALGGLVTVFLGSRLRRLFP